MPAFKISLIFIVATAAIGCLAPRADGPIQRTDAVRVELPKRDGPITWGMPISPASGPVTLRRIELIEVAGLEILGISTCEGSPLTDGDYDNCAPTGDPWPPAGVALRDVGGTVVDSAPDKHGGLLVGARLERGVSTGSIRGVRISYSYAGTDFQVEQPWSLELNAH